MQQIPFLHAALRSSEGIELARDDPQMFSPIIHGKDENGDPARSHDDAFFLPTDVDKDGRIDHVTIYAAGRFSVMTYPHWTGFADCPMAKTVKSRMAAAANGERHTGLC